MTTNVLSLTLASGEPLDVRDFDIDEALSRPFDVRLTAVSPNPDVDFEGAIGQPARFEILRTSAVDGETRYWDGVCASIHLISVAESGLSTYGVRVVPPLWLLTERTNYRVFQDKSELDIALEVLSGWGIQPTLRLDAGSYDKRRMRTQYAESDFDFVNRLLEEIGVTYFFDQAGGQSIMVLSDAPNRAASRPPVPFIDKPSQIISSDFVTAVQSRRDVRPGKFTQSDVDYRKALDYPLAASAANGNAVEAQLERYQHEYGSFLWKTTAGGDTPHADDRGPARTSERSGSTQVQKRLDGHRVAARGASFDTTAHDLRPGKVMTIAEHPRAELAALLLVESSHWTGRAADGAWKHSIEARYTDTDYRPPMRTPRPRTHGVESATVTGPAGETIHTDEFGRVRVHFHWDRTGASDETSSCWIPSSQPWAGAGYGAISLCRVGQEVLVDFLGADPDRPVVVGRVFTTTTPPPYQLPKYKMVTGHRSESYTAPPASGAGSSSAGASMAFGAMAGGSAAASAGAAPSTPGASMAVGIMSDGSVTGSDGSTPPAGAQDTPAQYAQNITNAGAAGPDGKDHTRSANGLTHDDTSGSELCYLQAQKDLHIAVKCDEIDVIGRNRYMNVSQRNDVYVGDEEHYAVNHSRTVYVGTDQTHTVTGEMSVKCSKNITTVTPTGCQTSLAQQMILLQAGAGQASTILMLPDGIVIDAKEVYINPGVTFMHALAAGKSLADAKAAADAQDKIDKNNEANAKDQKFIDSQNEAIDENPGDGLRGKDGTPAAGSNNAIRQSSIDQAQSNINARNADSARLGQIAGN